MMRCFTLLAIFLVLAGCRPRTVPPAPEPFAPEVLRHAFPAVGPGFTTVEFRARAGLVTWHVKNKKKALVGTLMIEDLVAKPEARATFTGSKNTRRGCPAIETSMGGGEAFLYDNRFRIEAVALDPSVKETTRTRWLEGFQLQKLKKSAP
jgi:hypothetical protein